MKYGIDLKGELKNYKKEVMKDERVHIRIRDINIVSNFSDISSCIILLKVIRRNKMKKSILKGGE